MKRPLISALALCALLSTVLAQPPVAAKSMPTAVQTLIDRATERLPANSKIVVADAATGDVLVNQNGNDLALPASTLKLVTAVVALETFNAQQRFVTRVDYLKKSRELTLVGGGDPMFNRKQLAELAKRTRGVVHAKQITLYTDASLWPKPTPAVGWTKGYVPDQVNPISALTLYGVKSTSPQRDFGIAFAKALRATGAKVTFGGARKTRGHEVARISSLPLEVIIGRMLRESDNNIAERVFRLSAIAGNAEPTWNGATAYARTTLQALGIDLTNAVMHDGSGLSRKDLLSSITLVQLLLLARDDAHPELKVLLDGHLLAVGGETGTLKGRYKAKTTKCAAGLVEAKTGSLKDVASLAGYVNTPDGLKAFAFIVNKLPKNRVNAVRGTFDWMLAGLVGC